MPDHSTIAEFRCRHERAPVEVFSGVLGLCARAGLASVGVVAIDGTKMSANASVNANRDFGQVAREIFEEAAEIDRREDELYGRERGDALPEHLRMREGRRKALREARERLERERKQAAEPAEDDDHQVAIELDPQQFVTRPQCRRAWVREGRRALESKREREGLAQSLTTGPSVCLRRVGVWSKSSPSSTLPIGPTRRGGRAGSLPSGRGGWRPAWSSRTSGRWCRAGWST